MRDHIVVNVGTSRFTDHFLVAYVDDQQLGIIKDILEPTTAALNLKNEA
jgi:hypothetical protein